MPLTVKSPSITAFPLTVMLFPMLTSDADEPILTRKSDDVLIFKSPVEFCTKALVPSCFNTKSPLLPNNIFLLFSNIISSATSLPLTSTLLWVTSEFPVSLSIVLSKSPITPWSEEIDVTPLSVLISTPSPASSAASLISCILGVPSEILVDLTTKLALPDSTWTDFKLLSTPASKLATPSLNLVKLTVDKPDKLLFSSATNTLLDETEPSVTSVNLLRSDSVNKVVFIPMELDAITLLDDTTSPVTLTPLLIVTCSVKATVSLNSELPETLSPPSNFVNPLSTYNAEDDSSVMLLPWIGAPEI